MDVAEFFSTVVKPNYEMAAANPSDFRLLWNAIVTMNTMAEFVALHRHDYAAISRSDLAAMATSIRDSSLEDLKFCAETLKHVRKIDGGGSSFRTVATSTGISPLNPGSWSVDGLDLIDVLQTAFRTLSTFPELK
jgi:hypothetical protein